MNGQALSMPRQRSLWDYVAKLLRLRWVIFVTGFKHARLVRKIMTGFLFLLALAAFVGVFFLTRFFVQTLGSTQFAQEMGSFSISMDSIASMVLSGAFLGILITSFGLLLQALYLANDMDFLLAAPIPIRAVFVSKLLQAILTNFTLVLLVGLPVLFGLGAARHYSYAYYPLVVVMLAFLSLAAAGISSLLVMGIVRIFPAKRVAEVLAFVGAIMAMTCSQWSNLTGAAERDFNPGQFAAGARVFSGLSSGWSPLAWGGRGLVELGEGRWLAGLSQIVLTLALSAAVFWLALNTAERLYYTGWASMQVGTLRRKAPRTGSAPALPAREGSRGPLAGLVRRLVPAQVRGIIGKDALELRRDLRNLSQLVTPLIMGIVFTIMLLRSGGEPPPGRGEAPEAFMEGFRTFLAYGSMAISLFVGWSLLQRLALMAFSMESKSYWIIKSAPVSATRLLISKFLVAYLPSLLIGWTFLFVVALLQKVPIPIVLYGLPAIALILAGLDGINLALGVRGANFNWSDPRRMASGGIGCLGTLASLGYLGVAAFLFFAPPIALPFFDMPAWMGQVTGLLVGGAWAVACTLVPLMMVMKRVDRLGEE